MPRAEVFRNATDSLFPRDFDWFPLSVSKARKSRVQHCFTELDLISGTGHPTSTIYNEQNSETRERQRRGIMLMQGVYIFINIYLRLLA